MKTLAAFSPNGTFPANLDKARFVYFWNRPRTLPDCVHSLVDCLRTVCGCIPAVAARLRTACGCVHTLCGPVRTVCGCICAVCERICIIYEPVCTITDYSCTMRERVTVLGDSFGSRRLKARLLRQSHAPSSGLSLTDGVASCISHTAYPSPHTVFLRSTTRTHQF